MNEKMHLAFIEIEQKLMSGENISKEDMKFYKSFLSAKKGTNAGNAGKRKIEKTGK